MAPIFLDRTIKASHSLLEISKLRLFTRTPPIVDNWDPRGVVGGGGCLADVLHVCQRRSGKKSKENQHLKSIKTN